MLNKAVVILALLISGVLIILAIGTHQSKREQISIEDVARVRLQRVLTLMHRIQQDTGRRMTGLSELLGTYYSAFAAPQYAAVSGNGRLISFDFHCRYSQYAQAYVTIGYLVDGEKVRTAFERVDTPLEEGAATKARINLYMSGLLEYRKTVKAYHDSLLPLMDSESTAYRATLIMKEPFPPAPYAHEYPASTDELAAYLSYIRKIENLAVLTDEWGQPLSFLIESGTFKCRSAGPDGQYDNLDDIIKTVITTIPERRRR